MQFSVISWALGEGSPSAKMNSAFSVVPTNCAGLRNPEMKGKREREKKKKK